MGNYLNPDNSKFQRAVNSDIYVDKTGLIKYTNRVINTMQAYVCVSRPRRFGKSMAADMLTAYYSKGCDSREVFSGLEITEDETFDRYLNKYDTVFLNVQEFLSRSSDVKELIARIKQRVIRELTRQYPDVELFDSTDLAETMQDIYAESKCPFVLIIDEWDCIFHKDFITDEDKKKYISFLSSLLKDKAYVLLSYMTGILPIAKYSSGSELNMFAEYTMVSEEKFSDAFGFTEAEVDMLYARFLKNTGKPLLSRSGLKEWYDGYHAKGGERIYNPRSVVMALTNNNLGNYWTSSGPYDEIYYYIEKNVAGVRSDLALMVSGESVEAKVQEYAATSMELTTREEIFSAMVVYGFLSSEEGKVRIPNRELMERFDEMLQKEPSLGYVYRLARESKRMLEATLHGDTQVMEQILEYAHNTETPLLSYNHEIELSAIVNLVYLSARDQYRVEREDKAGKGYVDFIFYPIRESDDAIILELKVDHTPDETIAQIKEKEYALRLKGKLAAKIHHTGRILAVGIGYDKGTKKHRCKVEELKG